MGRIAIVPFVSAAMVMSLFLGTPRNSSAQNALPTPGLTPQLLINQRAITVMGQGLATAPADTARIEFRFASRTPLDTLPAETPADSAEGNVGLPVEVALQPVIDALVAIKVPADNIQLQSSALESPKLLVTLEKPTRDRIQEVVKVVTSMLTSRDNLFIQGIDAEYAVKDCLPLERAARKAALRDAQNQVGPIALDLGIKIGEILFVTVFPSFGSSASSVCGSKVGVPTSPLLALSDSTPPYDPSANPEVQVRIQISITYAIKEFP
jgi:uncharacterized protein YggE